MNAVYYLTSGQADAKGQQTAQSQLKFWQLLYSCTKITFTRAQQQQFKLLLVAIVWHSHSKTDHCACNARTVPIWLMQAEPVACHPSLNQLDALRHAKHEPRWLSNDHITEGHRHKHVVWADSLWHLDDACIVCYVKPVLRLIPAGLGQTTEETAPM